MIEPLPREDVAEYIDSLPAMEQLLPSVPTTSKGKRELRDYNSDYRSLGSVLAMQVSSCSSLCPGSVLAMQVSSRGHVLAIRH